MGVVASFRVFGLIFLPGVRRWQGHSILGGLWGPALEILGPSIDAGNCPLDGVMAGMSRQLPAVGLALAFFLLTPRLGAQAVPAPFPHPIPTPATPTPTYRPTSPATEANALAQVYSHTTSAGPDDSFFLAGAGLGTGLGLWGPGPDGAGRRENVTVQVSAPDHVIATIPEGIPDGLFVGVVGDPARPDAWFRLNAPQPWWTTPDRASPGETVDLLGDELAERPDRARAWVYVTRPGGHGDWVTPLAVSRYRVSWRAPQTPGRYEVWVYAGTGGDDGWGGPVPLEVHLSSAGRRRRLTPAARTGGAIQDALNQVGVGGVVRLMAGTYTMDRSLVVPAGVRLEGTGRDTTTLKLAAPAGRLRRLGASDWGQSVSALQDVGDTLNYRVTAPGSGNWSVWVRYAAADAGFDMSGRTTLQADGGPAVMLQTLPNTGDWNRYGWARAATVPLTAGVHTLRWSNRGGGGINLDAFVLSRDPTWRPGALTDIHGSATLIVRQAEDVTDSRTVQAQFPGGDAGVVWLAGNGAGLADLTVLGSPLVSTGILIASAPDGQTTLEDTRVASVRVADIEGTFTENSAVYVANARGVVVQDCDLTGRAPLRFEGMSQARIERNRLHAVTRFGGNAEAAILGRTHALHQNIIAGNIVDSPDAAGGPAARRLIWFSSGLGSVSDNYIAGNVGRTCFGDVAGTDQNVGETILFETNMRVAYYGSPESASGADVTLPATGPFWPPLRPAGSEPPQDEYFLYVVRGKGLGQARHVVGRQGRTLRLDAPWEVPPDSHSLVLEALSHVHNIVADNTLSPGMSGLQLWIGGYRNIFADNVVDGERRQGIYLYGAMSTSAPTMPNQWNAGIGPLFYNTVEGNQIRDTEQGILLGVSDDLAAARGADWPRALGTVIRHNTVVGSRATGIEISAGSAFADDPADLAIEGTVAEFNDVQDAVTGFLAGPRTVGTLFRRNHGYFWRWPADAPPRAIATDGAREAVGSDNTMEGPDGWGDKRLKNDLEPVKK